MKKKVGLVRKQAYMKSLCTRGPLPLSVVDTIGEDILIKVKHGFRLRSKSKKLRCNTPLNGPNIFGTQDWTQA